MRSREEVLREFKLNPDEWGYTGYHPRINAMADRIRELEAPQTTGEPVEWMYVSWRGHTDVTTDKDRAETLNKSGDPLPLYPHPRPRVGVTEALRDVIEWALGERDAFPDRPERVQGKPYPFYWWRKEMRRRYEAALALADEAAPDSHRAVPSDHAGAVSDAQCRQCEGRGYVKVVRRDGGFPIPTSEECLCKLTAAREVQL